MPDPCNVHEAADAETKLEQLLQVLDDIGEADVCGECVAVMRSGGCLIPDEDAARLRRELGALRMENDHKPTVSGYELIADALKALVPITTAHRMHDISTKLEECMILLTAHINRARAERS